MVSGWFYPINRNQQKHNKAVSSNLINSIKRKKTSETSFYLDYLTNLDRDLDPDHQDRGPYSHVLDRSLDPDDVGDQQEQQQGFLRSRPSQPGRRSPPLKTYYRSFLKLKCVSEIVDNRGKQITLALDYVDCGT